MTFDSLVGALNYHMTARILDGVADGSVTLDEVRNDVVVMFVSFALCIGAHLGAWCLTHSVTGRFTLAVKDEVMRGILSMDTVFFDIHERHHPEAPEPRRLRPLDQALPDPAQRAPPQRDADHQRGRALADALRVPLGVDAELVLIVAIQCLSFRWIQRMHERGRKLGERVVETTHEVVKELRTVRAFAMEEEDFGPLLDDASTRCRSTSASS